MEQWCCPSLAFDSPVGAPGDEIPRQQPDGCFLLPVGRPASGAPMPGGGSRWRGEPRRTLAVCVARGSRHTCSSLASPGDGGMPPALPQCLLVYP